MSDRRSAHYQNTGLKLMPTLSWLGDTEARTAARRVPHRVLKPIGTYGDSASGNLLIQGDNLHALKALLPFYTGRVKCIYIDPPYNSRSAFSHYDDNLEHGQWLSMMYPRLELLRDLLAEDGSIWVSIDDREGHYLKPLMDEIFGRNNFGATFIWQKVDSPNDNKPPISPDHEFILCYERSKGHAGFRKKSDLAVLDAYSGPDSNGFMFRDRLLKKNGKESLRSDRETMFYAIEAPDGTPILPIHDDGREARWTLSPKGLKRVRDQDRLIWKQRERDGALVWIPYVREFAPQDPGRPHETILLDVKTSRQAKAHQRELLPDTPVFETVKPEQLVRRILEIATNPGDIVLDAFLGSGTTAAAAHKSGRCWIGIEDGEHALTYCIPRLTKVIDGEPGGISDDLDWQGGGGFRFMRLGDNAFRDDGCLSSEFRFKDLAAYLWLKDTKHPHPTGTFTSPLLGEHSGVAYILLYDGIVGDSPPESGNVLTAKTWTDMKAVLPPEAREIVIYGEACRLSPTRLRELGISFRQIPYDLGMR